jgi:hypothetical protein
VASELPIDPDTELLRVIFNTQINPINGAISSTAFTPPPSDEGLLSTEHGDRPGRAVQYREDVALDDVAGIWAVFARECALDAELPNDIDLPLIDDGGEDGKSPWHVSVDFRAYTNARNRVNSPGIRKGKYLRDKAQQRGRLA